MREAYKQTGPRHEIIHSYGQHVEIFFVKKYSISAEAGKNIDQNKSIMQSNIVVDQL